MSLLISLVGRAEALPLLRQPKAVPALPRFKVKGAQILAPDGSVFVPRGVNKGGLEWLRGGYDESIVTYQHIKSWGANFVRIPLSSAFALKRMCSYDKNYIKRVDRIVRWAEELGMLVLLDNHVSTGGLTCGIGNWARPHKAPDLHSLDFVKQLAERYKHRPLVAIDLYNEPHDITDAVWRHGGMVDGWRAVGMQQLLDAVRSTGNKNLVFVSGNHWANDLRMIVDAPLANDANVVYAAHSYPFTCNGVIPHTQPYSCNGQPLPPHLDARIAPAIGKRAVMLTEFGTQRSIPEEMQAPIEWAERHGIGWAAWLWSRGRMTDFCLLDSKGNPSVSGKPVRDALLRASSL